MYTSKKFSIKPLNEIDLEIEKAAELYPSAKKIFLADGNAMVLNTSRLLNILNKINSKLIGVRRISAYASPKDIENKSISELEELKDAGLTLIYVGIESGDDDLLRRINKGETSGSIEKNMIKTKKAGIKSSVMILNGLGGKSYSQSHATNSAALVSSIQPEYLSTLVLSFPYGLDHYKSRFAGSYIEMNTSELLLELYQFIEATQLEGVVFRSDHASNYLALKGILGRDKQLLKNKLMEAIQQPESGNLRKEWQRGL